MLALQPKHARHTAALVPQCATLLSQLLFSFLGLAISPMTGTFPLREPFTCRSIGFSSIDFVGFSGRDMLLRRLPGPQEGKPK